MGAALTSGTSLVPQGVSLATTSSVSVGATATAPAAFARVELGSAQVQMAQPGVAGVFLAPSSTLPGVGQDLGTQSMLLVSTSAPVVSWLDQGSVGTTVPTFALPNFGLIRDSGNWMPGDEEYADQPAKPTSWFDLFDAPIELEPVTLAGVWVGEAVGDSAADGPAAGDAGGGDAG
jgi:hypothetical protein